MGVMKVCFGSWRETFGRLKIDGWKIERESGALGIGCLCTNAFSLVNRFEYASRHLKLLLTSRKTSKSSWQVFDDNLMCHLVFCYSVVF
jgi:hypothetical protein